MRKIFICLLIVMLLTVTVSAKTSLVDDSLNLLTQDQRATLSAQLNTYHNRYDVSVALVTTDSLDGKPIATYAKDYYEQSGYANDCAILVICEAEGLWYIYTHGLCADMITNEEASQIGEVILNDLQAGAYFDAAMTFVALTAEPVCQQVAAINAEIMEVQQSRQNAVIYGLAGGLAVGVAVSVLLSFVAKVRRAPAKVQTEESQETTRNSEA